jgi:hypothetical protein
MPFDLARLVRSLTTGVFVATVSIPHGLFAQASDHVVSPLELQQAAVDASMTRQQNRDILSRFFCSEKATQALKRAHVDPEQVRVGVAGLSDEELGQLAARANKAQADFAAGNLNDRDLLIIVVAIAALILIIVAVR